MGLGDVGRIDDMTQIGPGEVGMARRTLAPGAAIGCMGIAAAPFHMVRLAGLSARAGGLGEPPQRRAAFARSARDDRRLTTAATEPERIEDLVEFLQVGMG